MHIINSRSPGFLTFIKFIFIFGLLAGCAKKPVVEIVSEYTPKVTLDAGDILEIKFFYNPELNVTQTVRPDGKINLQLAGEIDVHGKTPLEFQEELIKLYTPHLKNAKEITVVTQTLYSNRIFVGGEVHTPGLILMSGKLTPLEAIMQSGGFNLKSAKIKNVVIIRHKNGQRYGYKLDLSESLSGEKSDFFVLQPYDIVYVPRTKIANVNQWIDNYINNMIPQPILATIPYYAYRELSK